MRCLGGRPSGATIMPDEGSTPQLQEVLKRKYTFTVVADPEESEWIITFPDLPGCRTVATTWSDVTEMAKEAFEGWITARYEDGLCIPDPSSHLSPLWDWESVMSPAPYTTDDIAARLGVSRRRVQALASDRGLGRKVGRDYRFTERELELMTPRSSGRPRGTAISQ